MNSAGRTSATAGRRGPWRFGALIALAAVIALVATLVAIVPESPSGDLALDTASDPAHTPTPTGVQTAAASVTDAVSRSMTVGTTLAASAAHGLPPVAQQAQQPQQDTIGGSGTGDGASPQTDPTPDPNADDTVVESVPALDPSVPRADLGVEIVADRNPVLSESFFSYLVTVTNDGPVGAENVVVGHQIPDYLSFILTTGCRPDSDLHPDGLNLDTWPDCHLGGIGSGESKSYEVLVLTSPGSVGDHDVIATATSQTADPDPTNNEASFTSTINIRGTWREVSATADLAVAKIDLVDPVPALGEITYRIVVANTGPSAAVGVQVTEELPAGVTLVATTGCRNAPGVPVCELGTIAPGQTASYDVTVTADPGTTGVITNSVTVSSRSNDTNSSNNTATETTTVNLAPTAVDDAVTVGEDTGPTVVEVTANDTDPDGDPLSVTALDTAGTAGSVTLNAGAVRYDPNGQFESLAAGQTATDGFGYTIADPSGATDSAIVTVTIEGADDAPTITSAGGGDSTTANFAENATGTVVDIDATDPEGDTENGGGLTYALGGPDAALFTIDTDTGVVSFNAPPDFENPLDAGGDNVYDIIVTVTDSTLLTDTQTIAVTVLDGNEPPTITSDGGGDTAAFTYAENATGPITDVDATDVEGQTENGGGLVYSLSGPDAGAFVITQAGVLSFASPPDFDLPGDANGDNDYQVTVTVGDTGLLTDSQDITVTVTNVSEPPVITSNGGLDLTVTVDENTTGSVTDVNATDPEGDTENGGGLTYALSGPDAARFSIDAAGLVTFNTPPDFENPTDAGADNTYDVTVTVTDSDLLTDTQNITVVVSNAADPPVITSDGGGATASVSAAEGTSAVTDVNATDDDGDTEGAGLTYAITGGADQARFTLNPATGELSFIIATDFENPVDVGGDNDYEVQVTVTDSQSLSDTQAITVTVTNVNERPSVIARSTVNVFENATGVEDVDATDPDGETENGGGLTYSLSGPDAALFTIDATGQLAFDTAPNYEAPADSGMDNGYDITVTVTDAGLLTDSQTTLITVFNRNETPVITSDGGGDAASLTVFQGQTLVTDVNATDEDGSTEGGGGLTYSLAGGTDAALFTVDTDSGELSFLNPATEGTYVVIVRVDDPFQFSDSQTITVTVPANTAPTAVDDTYAGLPVNVLLDAGGRSGAVGVDDPDGVLTKGTDTDTENTLTVTQVNGAALISGSPITLPSGATLTMYDDGTFTYLSAVASTATDDSFTYTISDGLLTDTATVTIGYGTDTIWFLDSAVAGPGTGTSNDPFSSVANFNSTAADETGDIIYLHAGPYGGNFTLLDNQQLLGAGVALTSGALSRPAGGRPLLSTVTGNAITLGANNTVRGLDIGDTGVYAITGTDFGAPTINTVDITGSGGIARSGGILNLVRGDLTNVALGAQSSSSSAGPAAINLIDTTGTYNGGAPVITNPNSSGIIISGGSGSATFSGGSISGAGVDGFRVISTSKSVAMAGAITQSNGLRPVRIENATGGVVLSGAVNVTGSIGILLNSSTSVAFNAPVTMTGTTDIAVNSIGTVATFANLVIDNSSTNQRGVNASGSGSLGITTGSINAGSESAVQAANIELGVTLTSVSSSGGTAPGILLRNTTGSFTANGGTVADKTGPNQTAGQPSPTGNGIGVYLQNAGNVTLSGMTINGTMQNFGIQGFGLNGTTTFTNLTMNGTYGDSPGSDESAVALNNISGTLNVTGGTYGGGHEDVFAIVNDAGTLNANVSNVTFNAGQAATGDNGLEVRTLNPGSATMNLGVHGSTFTGSRSVMLFVDVAGSGGGTINIGTTTANTFTQGATNLPGGGAIEVLASGSGNTATVSMNVADNTITAGSNTFEGDPVVLGSTYGFAGTTNIRLTGNRIGTSGVDGSAVNPGAGAGDSGVVITQNGSGTMNALIDNNSILDWNASGLEVFFDAEGPNDPVGGSINLTVTNNTVTDQTGVAGVANAGIFVFGADQVDVCMDIRANTITNPNAGGHEIGIDILPAAPQTFVAPGITAPGGDAELDALLRANNGLAVDDVDVFVGATWSATPASCPTPP